MTTQSKHLLIFGATGLIGKHITRAIVSSDKFESIAIFTSPNTLKSKTDEIEQLQTQGVKIITGDLTSEADVTGAYSGIDTVVSCVGRPVIHTQLKLIELADRHPDVKRFFPSEYGTDIEYWPSSASEKPHQQKLKVRALLKGMENLEYTYVVTGPYGDADSALYLSAKTPDKEAGGSFNVARRRAVLIEDGDGKISLTTMRDVGKLVVAALLAPGKVRNRALHVNSFTTTPREMVKEFEKQTGEAWEISYTSLDQLKKIEEQAWADGLPTAGPLTLRRIWASGGTLYDRRDNDLIGMETSVDTVEDAVAQAIRVQEAQHL